MPEPTSIQRRQMVDQFQKNLDALKEIDRTAEEGQPTTEVKKNTFLYASLLSFIFLLICRGVLWLKEFEDFNETGIVLILYIAFAVPMALFSIYFLEKFPYIGETFPLKLGKLGMIPIPGGPFVVPVVMAAFGAVIGFTDYTLIKQSPIKKIELLIDEIDGKQGTVVNMLGERISSSFLLEFIPSWPNSENSNYCSLNAVLIIPQQEFENCELGPLSSGTLPQEGLIYKNSQSNCTLRGELEQARSLDAESSQFWKLQLKYQRITEKGKYHGIFVVGPTDFNSRPIPADGSIRPTLHHESTVVEKPTHILPVFTLTNKNVTSREIKLNMPQLKLLTNICGPQES